MKKKVFKSSNAFVALFVASMFFATNASAQQQQGDMAFGGHISQYLESGFSLTGIGAKFRYTIIEQTRVEGVFTYFFPKEVARFMGISGNVSMVDFSVNAHYLFPIADRLTLYPLVGLGILGLRATVSGGGASVRNSENHVILNIGGGADIKVADNISINIEPKLLRTFDNDTRGGFIISAGVIFNF